ncbi:hypothetical protein HYC85_021212 [Camellia sinensis]|uniref:Copine C-terminal domain-containing protein n=1 Tax=Camellia sinensis TaxID=4442 RepID=A0A7J7GIG6_CAMSI|nr:hypothetical protein HYC85_021212 [Camellia sinensis]
MQIIPYNLRLWIAQLMGSSSSKGTSRRQFSSSGSSSFNQREYQQPAYPQQNPYYTPQHHHAPAPYNYGAQTPQRQRKLDRRYSRIADNYQTLEQVTDALAQAGLESSNLIVGIDFTKSNEWTASTHDQDVFSFERDARFCDGFEEVLRRYREIVPHLRLSGPTSFAPVIEMAMSIVEESRGQYHVLLIIADGQIHLNNVHLNNRQTGHAPNRVPRPPPLRSTTSLSNSSKPFHSSSFQQSTSLYPGYDMATTTGPSSSSLHDNQACPICFTNPKNMAFGCGHQDWFVFFGATHRKMIAVRYLPWMSVI